MAFPKYNYRAWVVRVIDGDTLNVDFDLGFAVTFNYNVRLAEVDTWEIRTRDLEEKAKGIEARNFVMDLCPPATEIFVQCLRYDKYGGRVDGIIYLDEAMIMNLANLLFENGHCK